MSYPTDPPAPWVLKSIETTGLPDRIPVDADGATLGRAATNSIVLTEQNYPEVSAHHARLSCDGDGRLLVMDLGSRNGTLVNDEAVQERPLRDGDILQLGPGGPKFLCEAANSAAVTRIVAGPRSQRRPRSTGDLGHSTVFRVKRALGLAEDANVGELMADSEHRSRRRLGVAITALVILVAGVVWLVSTIQEEQENEINALAADNKELRKRLAITTDSFETQQLAWENQRTSLAAEAHSLQERITEFTSRAQSSSSQLEELNTRLAETNDKLQRYDPIHAEKARLLRVERIQQIQRAVVFVETKMRFRSLETGQLLCITSTDPDSDVELELSDEGTPYERESSGSGFCILANGSIITNAHVVLPEDHDTIIEMDADTNLRPELLHAVVFSGTDRRHDAEVVKVLDEGEDDLALINIEPFDDMPHLTGFRTDTPLPPALSDVYLHGFPLGKRALQEGDTVIASSFRGILSRIVSNWLQVDAAVHPGNSGGPLTDAYGNVIGVVSRVQRISGETIAPDMGYAIPVRSVARLFVDEGEASDK